MPGPIRLGDLPEAILHKIAQSLEPWERRLVLPLVSRGWARLLEGPSPAWEQIIIAFHHIDDFDADARSIRVVPNLKAMKAWLRRRAGAVRNLQVVRSERHRHFGYREKFLPASVLAAALGTHAHRLRVLHIELAAIALSSADLDALLGHAPNLEQLSLDFWDVPAGWDDRSTVLMQTLSQLPALQSLRIRTSSIYVFNRHNCPTVVELAALSSAQLTYLDLDIDTSSESTLSFGDLPSLTECRLGGCGEADVYVTTPSFSGAPNLVAFLARYIDSIHLAPGCFTGLSFLTDLRLIECRLLVVPPALAGVQGTLRRLDLSRNSRLRMEDIGYGILLALPALKHLLITKSNDETAMVWYLRSVQYLSRFLTEWQALHPGVEPPTLTLNIESDDD